MKNANNIAKSIFIRPDRRASQMKRQKKNDAMQIF